MEGSLFYWVLWLFWVYITFFMDKQNRYRTKLAVVTLLVIILSNVHFVAAGFEFYASGLFLLILSYLILSKKKLGSLLYSFICSFILTISYVTFNLFVIYDPVWVIFQKEWMMGICFSILAILLQTTLKGRLLIFTSGTMHGEIFYAIYLNKFEFSYPVGTIAYLDVFALTVLLLVSWSILENAGIYYQNHLQFLAKGKQKSS
ncbi:YphA family membrane protein [Neobacillus vireti]|uniref:YphA family membrane protein n=1 Tax=Neobacillus vireti TaxID=220686 RepID=UPI002FFF4413